MKLYSSVKEFLNMPDKQYCPYCGSTSISKKTKNTADCIYFRCNRCLKHWFMESKK